jgi:hypothetical protein
VCVCLYLENVVRLTGDIREDVCVLPATRSVLTAAHHHNHNHNPGLFPHPLLLTS